MCCDKNINNKSDQKKLLKEIMEADEKDGLYQSKIKTVKDDFKERFPKADQYSVFDEDEVIDFGNYVLEQYKKGLIEDLKDLVKAEGTINDYLGISFDAGLLKAIKLIKQK